MKAHISIRLIVMIVAGLAIGGGAVRAQDSLNVTKVGELYSLIYPSEIVDVALSGSHVYAANNDSTLRVIDVSNPAAPAEVGICQLPGGAAAVVVVGTLAYVADGYHGLRIIDVSDPTQPLEIGSIEWPFVPAGDVAVQGSYAYLSVGGSGIRIINVSNPSLPFLAGSYFVLGQGFNALTVAGSYVYAADYTYGLRIIDVSNPISPTSVAVDTFPDWAYDVVVSGLLAYVACGAGIYLVDVSTPSAPYNVGRYGAPVFEAVVGVALSGSHAYAVQDFSGFQVVNVSNPASPVETGFYNTPGRARRLVVAEPYAYVADGTNFGIYNCSQALPVEPEQTAPAPHGFALHPCAPNPFNPATMVSYELRAASHVNLNVYDTSGRLVSTLLDGWREAGEHEITFSAGDLPSGLYLAKLTAGNFSEVQKLVLLK